MDTLAPILAIAMIVFGFLLLAAGLGMLAYAYWPRPEAKQALITARINNLAHSRYIKPSLKILMIVVLLLSFLSGYSILVLLAATAEYQLSPTQETLLNTADWMVKVQCRSHRRHRNLERIDGNKIPSPLNKNPLPLRGRVRVGAYKAGRILIAEIASYFPVSRPSNPLPTLPNPVKLCLCRSEHFNSTNPCLT